MPSSQERVSCMFGDVELYKYNIAKKIRLPFLWPEGIDNIIYNQKYERN